MSRVEVRYATEADTETITSIRRRAGCPESGVKGKRFLVAEERGEVLAAVRYRRARGGIVLDGVVADPQVEELRFATALYCGAGELARAAGLRLVWAECDAHREYLLESGYVRRVGGWRLDVDWSMAAPKLLPERGWRRVLALWSATDVPFFRAFWF